jgi:hypothetical protein
MQTLEQEVDPAVARNTQNVLQQLK